MKFYTGMYGLGDTIYQRAVVHALHAVYPTEPIYLRTAWPQLYSDMPTRCVKPDTRLRTQHKNIQRQGLNWCEAPAMYDQRLGYRGHGTMLSGMFDSVEMQPRRVRFDLPTFTQAVKTTRPYIVVRPGTVRTEWIAAARNPDPWLICRVIDELRQDFDIISIADLEQGKEYAVEPLPYADQRFHAGELRCEDLMALVQNAAGVVGGVGWLLPAALAYRTPMLLLYGGWGHINGPQHILDDRLPTENLVQVFPDKFCMCNDRLHNCDLKVSDIAPHLSRFRDVINKVRTNAEETAKRAA